MFALFKFRIQNYFRMLFRHFAKSKIKAVHDSDLPELLNSLGVLEKIKNGKVNCVYCGDAVNLDNLQAVSLKNKEVKFICSKPICISKL